MLNRYKIEEAVDGGDRAIYFTIHDEHYGLTLYKSVPIEIEQYFDITKETKIGRRWNHWYEKYEDYEYKETVLSDKDNLQELEENVRTIFMNTIKNVLKKGVIFLEDEAYNTAHMTKFKVETHVYEYVE